MNTHMNLPTAANNWGLTPTAKSARLVANKAPRGSDPNWLAAGGKFRSVAQGLLVVALEMGGSLARAEVDYTGDWVSCKAKQESWYGDGPYTVLSIQSVDGVLEWDAFEGKNSTYRGLVHVKKNEVVLRGCSYTAGEPDDANCFTDAISSPVFKKFSNAFFSSKTKVNDSTLTDGTYIKATGKTYYKTNEKRQIYSFDPLIAACKRLVNKYSEQELMEQFKKKSK